MKGKALLIKLINKSLLLICPILLFIGCKKELEGDNFIEVQPPAKQIQLNLDLIPQSDTIHIMEETTFTYTIDIKDLEYRGGNFRLGNQTYGINLDGGEFTIDPSRLEYGYDSLILEIQTNSGSGSIADQTGFEVYDIAKSWIVYIDNRPPPKLDLTSHINEDGYLEFNWSKCEQSNFQSYVFVPSSSANTREYFDPSITSYVDSNFIGGEYFASIQCKTIKNQWGEKTFLNLDEEYHDLSLIKHNLDSISVSWTTSPYNVKYRLEWGTLSNESIETLDSFAVIKDLEIGRGYNIKLSVISKNSNDWSYNGLGDSKFIEVGEKLFTSNSGMECGYNPVSKLVYLNDYNTLRTMSLNPRSYQSSYKVDNLIYSENYSSAYNSNKVAVSTFDDVIVFNSSDLTSATQLSDLASQNQFEVTNNDLLAYYQYGKYILLDLNTLKSTDTLVPPNLPSYGVDYRLSTAKNGKYMGLISDVNLQLYDITNGKLSLRYTKSNDYTTIFFNPENPEEIYLTHRFNNTIEIRSASSFSLISTINIPFRAYIQNIDPETKNLLILGAGRVAVMKAGTSDVLFNHPSRGTRFWLFESNLFSSNGYFLDLTDEL